MSEDRPRNKCPNCDSWMARTPPSDEYKYECSNCGHKDYGHDYDEEMR